MIILGALAAIISMFFPFAGVLFIFSISGKYQQKFKGNLFFAAFAVSALFFRISGVIENIMLYDLLIGIVVPSFLYLYFLDKKVDRNKTIFNCFIFVIGYSLIRTLLFHEAFTALINQGMEENRILLLENLPQTSNETEIFIESLDMIKDFFLNYFTGIWALIMILAFYAGSLLHSRRSKEDSQHRFLRLPFYIAYLLIIVLVIYFSSVTRNVSINLFFIIGSFFLVQGFSVMDFFWGKKGPYLV